jgi:hypothetical protein
MNMKHKCSVPDCGATAVTKAAISINNQPKRKMPVCRMHADAAQEDSSSARANPAQGEPGAESLTA